MWNIILCLDTAFKSHLLPQNISLINNLLRIVINKPRWTPVQNLLER